MKLSPIRNPHSKTSKVEKLSKREEKTLLLQKTKYDALQKYNVRGANFGPGGHNKLNIKGKNGPQATGMGGAMNVRGDDEFKLGEKVTKESQGIKLLQEGYLQSYIDFFYLTNETTPSVIVPSQKLIEEYKMNKKEKHHLELSEESLVKLSEDLVEAENYLRENHTIEWLNQYEGVCNAYERLNDYETASYFYNRCLEVSKEAKYIDGEAKAYMGLGIWEENVFNIFESMRYHETALEKAIDGNLPDIIRKISKELVRVYNNIAKSYETKNDFDKSLEYFEKCLDACKKADDPEMEAKWYFKIGSIYEKMDDLQKAVEFVNKFLEICKSDTSGSKIEKKKKLIGNAHKKLAELHSKLGNANDAIANLEALLNIAYEGNNKQGQAEAALKLGLLHYKEGLIPISVKYLTKHFDLARTLAEGSLIDSARVNLGIAQSNLQIDKYFKVIMSDVHSVINYLDDPKADGNKK